VAAAGIARISDNRSTYMSGCRLVARRDEMHLKRHEAGVHLDQFV